MNGMFPGMGSIDPSKMSPQTIGEISELMRSLTPEQTMKMQTLMHNAMAGLNVNHEMMEFEKSLPPTFREKMARIQYLANGVEMPPEGGATSSALTAATRAASSSASIADPTNANEARLVILHSVAGGLMKPEDAIKVLFPEG